MNKIKKIFNCKKPVSDLFIFGLSNRRGIWFEVCRLLHFFEMELFLICAMFLQLFAEGLNSKCIRIRKWTYQCRNLCDARNHFSAKYVHVLSSNVDLTCANTLVSLEVKKQKHFIYTSNPK
jgi:hypothetical protein